MTWTKLHARRRGELEFHFANELRPADPDKVRRAIERHERRHTHP